jgi:hypothetical protein
VDLAEQPEHIKFLVSIKGDIAYKEEKEEDKLERMVLTHTTQRGVTGSKQEHQLCH